MQCSRAVRIIGITIIPLGKFKWMASNVAKISRKCLRTRVSDLTRYKHKLNIYFSNQGSHYPCPSLFFVMTKLEIAIKLWIKQPSDITWMQHSSIVSSSNMFSDWLWNVKNAQIPVDFIRIPFTFRLCPLCLLFVLSNARWQQIQHQSCSSVL